jgi:hypothetical protein
MTIFLSRKILGFAPLLSVLTVTCTLDAQNDHSVDAFKKITNSKNYILVSPAENWAYPGGLLFAKKGAGAATFVDLPSHFAKPAAQDATIDFPAVKATKSFSITAVLTGLASLIGGNPGLGAGHKSTLTFQELTATGKRITLEQANSVVLDGDVKALVKNWLSQPNQQAFVVAAAFTTTNFSISTTSAWNADLSFNGSPVSKCDPAASSAKKTTATTSTTNTTKTSNTTKLTKKAATTATTASTSNASSGSTLPGGELHFCYSNDNTLTMKTTSPLVFAIAAYKITTGQSGALELAPIFALTPNGEAESTLPAASTAAGIQTQWTYSKWPSDR